MSSEAITRNDLAAILNEVLPVPSYVNEYNVTSLITAATGSTINAATLYVYGMMAQLIIEATFSSNQTADTSYGIGTLDASICPKGLATLTSTYGAGQISAAGVASFRPQVNLNGNTKRYFTAIYILNSRYPS